MSSLLDEKPTLAQPGVVVLVGATVVVVAGTVVEVVGPTLLGGAVGSVPADVARSPPPQPARARRATTAMADTGEEMFRHMLVPPRITGVWRSRSSSARRRPERSGVTAQLRHEWCARHVAAILIDRI
jgi:hypothetical protein